jgi:SAM-dependent methyltransferase
MPLARASVDLALGDGSLSVLEFPSDYAKVFRELGRVLRPGSRCVLRCFMQVDEQETIDEVFADLHRGGIGNFHVLKWRLLMALQSNAEEGVKVKGVWTIINETWTDLHLLAESFAWPVQQVLTISAYRNVETRYTFPTRTQYNNFFITAGFSVSQVKTQSYELGERCPTFVLEWRGREASGS